MGELSYEAEARTTLDTNIIMAVIIAIGVALIAIIVLLIMWRRNSTKHDRQMKTLKARMDMIEMKVRGIMESFGFAGKL